MDKSKRSNKSNNNENNIEKQIFSMLENVLKEDSDDSIESERRIPENNNKNQLNNINRLNFHYQKKEKKLFHQENLDNKQNNTNRFLNTNYQNNLGFNNFLNFQNQRSQPQIFINNIPVTKDIDTNENKDIIFRPNNNSPRNMLKQIPHFNNLSPISKQFKNQSPRNKNEENIVKNVQLPKTNRLTVAHIGMNLAYNNFINNNNSPKISAKVHSFVRNNTINHSMTKLCLNNKDNNSSTCTTNRY